MEADHDRNRAYALFGLALVLHRHPGPGAAELERQVREEVALRGSADLSDILDDDLPLLRPGERDGMAARLAGLGILVLLPA